MRRARVESPRPTEVARPTSSAALVRDPSRSSSRTILNDVPEQAFTYAYVAIMVLTGWLLLLACIYWQYCLLEGYLLPLAWALVISTFLRRLGEATENVNLGFPEDPAFDDMMRFCKKPFLDFYRKGLNGIHDSKTFFGMMWRCWLALLIWKLLGWFGALIFVICLYQFFVVVPCVQLSLWSRLMPESKFGIRARITTMLGRLRITTVLGWLMMRSVMVFLAFAFAVWFVAKMYSECQYTILAAHAIVPALNTGMDFHNQTNLTSTLGKLNGNADGNVTAAETYDMLMTICNFTTHSLQLSSAQCTTVSALLQGWLVNLETQLCDSTSDSSTCVAADPTSDAVSMEKIVHMVAGKLPGVVNILRKVRNKLFSYGDFKSWKEWLGSHPCEKSDAITQKSVNASWKAWLVGQSCETSGAITLDDMNAAKEEIIDMIEKLRENMSSIKNFATNAVSFTQSIGNVTWSTARIGLNIIVNVLSSLFDAFFKFIVFATALGHLYFAENTLSETLKPLFGSVDERGIELHEKLEKAMCAVEKSVANLALFNTLFTGFVYFLFDSPLFCIPTAAAAILSVVVPSSTSAIPMCLLPLLWYRGSYFGCVVLSLLCFVVWWYVPDAIYREIPGGHPFLTGLSVVMGASCFGPIGIVVGPVLLVVDVVVFESIVESWNAPGATVESSL